MTQWAAGADVGYREDIIDGLWCAPEALRDLLAGRHFGKVLIRL